MSATSAKGSIQKPTRSGPILRLDIAAALGLGKVGKPILVREYQSPTLTLESAKREVSKHPLPEYLPDIVEQQNHSRERLQRSGDAGTHDCLHWALQHTYDKQPRNSWDSCSCVGGTREIDSDYFEPMTEDEFVQRRVRLHETYEDLEASTQNPVSTQLRAGSANDEVRETIDMDLSAFPLVQNRLQEVNITIGNQNNEQSIEDAVGPVELLEDLQNDLEVAASVVMHGQGNQTDGGTNSTVEEPEVGRRTRFHEHLDSLDAPVFRLSLAGLTPPQQSTPMLESNCVMGTTSSGNDSEQASSILRHKGIFIPTWLWCVLWITLIGFLIGFSIMMSLFVALRHEGKLHAGKISRYRTLQPCVCNISPSPFNGAHGMDESMLNDDRPE
ncbi:uncharacterized protein CLUP02_17167 [Colletotrichum lupini]|uniref:Uncharacterized protein n=1 Tax=Colletotrichum lupini TaxID=145971 RepID=A0A9Q8TBJ2_9PEZI|nr:uncharacterized protein CLUP02_17167 [Colletotrichum lupini]UQC91631.1 hypothetical protein CLUP02_17167 [Colletotrichum lupini]